MDDIDLLRRYAADRSEAAFAELVRRQVNFVYRAAVRQAAGDVHRAEDVTQIVFTLLARKAGALTRHTSLTGWLYTTTHFTMAENLRSERRRQIREQQANAMPDHSTDEIPEAHWGRLRPVLDEAMQDLSVTDREAILLRFFEGLPFADVGARLSLREDTARMRVSRALDRLRVSLARRGVMSTTAAISAIMTNEAATAAPAGLAATVTGTALASSAGSAATGAGSFLGTAKATFLAAGLLSLALGTAYYEWRDALQTHRALASANQWSGIKQQRTEALEQSAAKAEQGRDEVRRSQAGLRSGQNGLTEGWVSKPVDREKFLRAFPEARSILKGISHARLAADYGAFYRSAGLTADQIRQFEAAMAEASLQATTITTTQIETAASQPPESILWGILGDPAYLQFEDYSPNVFARGFAGQVAAAIGQAAPALTAEQADRLAALIAANGSAVGNGRTLNPSSVAWDAVIPESQRILSAAQWRAAEWLFLEGQFDQVYAEAIKTQRLAAPE